MIKKIAILASGGNSPAMNNAMITLVRKAKSLGWEVELISNGYEGIILNKFFKPDLKILSYFYANGNIYIGSSRYPEFKELKVRQKAYAILKKHKIDCLFVIGGDGSYHGALGLSKLGMKVVCLPGTIDNDINNTEKTIGFSTALNNVVTGIDNLRDCFDSHSGVCLVEIMGRRFPDLTINAAIATQAEGVSIAEKPLTAEEIVEIANKSYKQGHRSCIICVSEKIYGENGLPTLNEITKKVAELTYPRMVRCDVLGYTQRGGVPSAEDRILASQMAMYAIEHAENNKMKAIAIGVEDGKLKSFDLNKVLATKKKTIDDKKIKEYLKFNCY